LATRRCGTSAVGTKSTLRGQGKLSLKGWAGVGFCGGGHHSFLYRNTNWYEWNFRYIYYSLWTFEYEL